MLAISIEIAKCQHQAKQDGMSVDDLEALRAELEMECSMKRRKAAKAVSDAAARRVCIPASRSSALCLVSAA